MRHGKQGVKGLPCLQLARLGPNGPSRVCLLCPGSSDVDLFRYGEGIIDLDAKIPLRWSFAGATERVRVRGVSTRGATVTFSYRLAGALRPIPVEPSEEKCHNDRACGRTHPCRSEA